jgi:hypothetical protein
MKGQSDGRGNSGNKGQWGYWRLRSRKDGIVWSVIASAIAVAVYWLVLSFLAGGPSVFGAVGLGIGTMAGGLLGTLYWLPRENGS